MYIKRWESGRNPSRRNDNSKPSSARIRQLRKAAKRRHLNYDFDDE